MTELLTRQRSSLPSRTPPAAPNSSSTVFAVAAAACAAGAGLLVIAVVVITTWAASLRGGAGAADALRAVAQIWLVTHRVAITIGSGQTAAHVALLPLGLLALPAYALFRAGRWFAHATEVVEMRGALIGAVTMAAAYAFITAVVASASVSKTVHPAAGQALLAGGCVAMVFGGAGIAHGAGLTRPTWDGLPDRLRSVASAAATGLAVLLGIGAVLAVGATLLHVGRVTGLGGALGPGPVGSVALFLACLVYLPNAVVWSAAYAVGPGFAVGAGTSVSPLGVHLGAVPSFPLLGALPASGSAPALSLPFVVMPVVAGAAVGVLLIRRHPAQRIGDAALYGLLAGASAGAGLAALAALSGGPAGPGRMATIGPSAWQVGLAAALELGLAGACAAAEVQRRLLRG
jgi:hypothetical protein